MGRGEDMSGDDGRGEEVKGKKRRRGEEEERRDGETSVSYGNERCTYLTDDSGEALSETEN